MKDPREMTDAETWAREDVLKGCNTSRAIVASVLEVLDAERAKVALLTQALGDMVRQHFQEVNPGVYESFLSDNQDALRVLVDVGAMELVKDGHGRNYWAKFKEEAKATA
jgi:hypothetical protein